MTTLLASLRSRLPRLHGAVQHVFVRQRKAWLYGVTAYLFMTVLNVLLALALPVPATVSSDPALRWQLQQTNASLDEINHAIDKLAERKALFEQ